MLSYNHPSKEPSVSRVSTSSTNSFGRTLSASSLRFVSFLFLGWMRPAGLLLISEKFLKIRDFDIKLTGDVIEQKASPLLNIHLINIGTAI